MQLGSILNRLRRESNPKKAGAPVAKSSAAQNTSLNSPLDQQSDTPSFADPATPTGTSITPFTLSILFPLQIY